MGVAFIVVEWLVAVRRPADPVARRLVVLFLSIAAIMQTYGSWGPLWLTGFLLLVVVPFAQIFSAYAALALAVTFPQPSSGGIRRFLRRLNPWLLVTTLAVGAATIRPTIRLLRPPPLWVPLLGGA